jgi:hypothetical protein
MKTASDIIKLVVFLCFMKCASNLKENEILVCELKATIKQMGRSRLVIGIPHERISPQKEGYENDAI